ncbi:ABC transporter substrate-binding protein [Sediminicoccus rosea]|jgi:NitT/TauT family transport system substrate-binding protein|uniref:Thiamine pyrimidine synthase n=1 Tax=Sediminicoccus rosea TaxID=1225128 RepID=A0ABZ0PH63_9PROT|nr:ABC transporter substrate-binding protein [Sediminicoccus rosea]WPB84475.1 ABC transporter substrate-binding protein [Sediminicoccus rosea]
MTPRRHLLLATGTAALAAPGVLRAQPGTRLRLTLDWAFQSPNAFALVARERGYFREAGIDVQIDRGQGSGGVPPALAAGSHEMGYADINPAIRFLAQNPDSGLICVAVLHDRAPLCVITRADGPIRTPKDLEGRRLAAPDFDSGRQLFPAFARAAGVDAGRVTFLSVAPALREPMLVRREVDGVTGFVTTSALALKGIGLQIPQQRIMMYYDHGLNLYGGALLTTRAYAERNPAVVRGAVAALIRGFRDTLANPAGMIQVLRQVEPLTDAALEMERHQLNVERVIMTDNVRANGLSAVDMTRMQTGIAAVEGAFNLPARVQAGQFYLPDFLPPAEQRRI